MMIVSRVIEVQESDPVGAVRGFLRALLDNRIVDCVFAPVDLAAEAGPHSQIVSGADAMDALNPLLPLMLNNAAIALEAAMAQEPHSMFGAVLRPCEVRALVELAKRDEVDVSRVVIVGMDCLATYDEDFYHDVSADHPGEPDWLMNEALRFARLGQITPYRYRLACQMCHRPAADASAADMLLGVVGVDAFTKILVLADEPNDMRLKLHRVTDRKATEREVAEREVALWRLAERRAEAAERKLVELGLADADTEAIITLLNTCTLCGECLDACPMCDRTMRAALEKGRDAFFDALMTHNQRLVSCDGCGMCEMHCPEGIPLAAINRTLSRRVQTELAYTPGRDVNEQPPWMT